MHEVTLLSCTMMEWLHSYLLKRWPVKAKIQVTWVQCSEPILRVACNVEFIKALISPNSNDHVNVHGSTILMSRPMDQCALNCHSHLPGEYTVGG